MVGDVVFFVIVWVTKSEYVHEYSVKKMQSIIFGVTYNKHTLNKRV